MATTPTQPTQTITYIDGKIVVTQTQQQVIDPAVYAQQIISQANAINAQAQALQAKIDAFNASLDAANTTITA
jgi:hypothetical protein